jgi:hypothetical protein
MNGTEVAFKEEENNYRRGGAVIPAGQFRAMLSGDANIVEIQL